MGFMGRMMGLQVTHYLWSLINKKLFPISRLTKKTKNKKYEKYKRKKLNHTEISSPRFFGAHRLHRKKRKIDTVDRTKVTRNNLYLSLFSNNQWFACCHGSEIHGWEGEKKT